MARRLPATLLRLLPALLLLGQLAGCSGDPGTGPQPVKWDRYTCERCRMVLGDRQHAAQIRLPDADGRPKVYFFDDLGCALIWLQDQDNGQGPGTEIWVTDWRDGHWIDARGARYLGGQQTPMAYGFGAQEEAAPETIDFEQARRSILAREDGHQPHHHAGHPRPAGD